ncbi:MAG: NADH-quinone oxidoreductase subunit J [Pyrinomonadaceae bacterium]
MTLHGWEAIFFWIFSAAALFAALLTIMARSAVHSALFLISALVAVAALFVLLGAEFIAGVQILVYVGGVMVLFLFVIMLVDVGAEERAGARPFNRPAEVAASVVFAMLLAGGLAYAINTGYAGLRERDAEKLEQTLERRAGERQNTRNAATGTMKITDDTERVGFSLYRYASLPFEIASLLLLVAIIGSVMLARTSKQEAAADDSGAEESHDLAAIEQPRVENQN